MTLAIVIAISVIVGIFLESWIEYTKNIEKDKDDSS